MKPKLVAMMTIAIAILVAVSVVASRWQTVSDIGFSSLVPRNQKKGDVLFQDGFVTEEQDQGRPVRLIAAALGVESQAFRDAFRGVKPVHGMLGPSSSRAKENKEVLLDALGPFGITNERLDEVSDFYRYSPGHGNLWKHNPARATAIVSDGKITGFKIIDAGSGYLSDPTIIIVGYEAIKVKATLRFSKDFTLNGSIESLNIVGSSKLANEQP